MKKFITKAAMVAAFAAVAGYGVYANQKKEATLSDTALANVEALARIESTDECYDCVKNSLYICKMFGDWGGCIGDPNLRYT